MKPIVPVRIVAGSILAEASPLDSRVVNLYRGVDLRLPLDEVAAPGRSGDPYRDAARGSPYREVAPGEGAEAPVAVLVRELSELLADDAQFLDLFERGVRARWKLGGSPAPALLHVLERDGRVLASVEEFVDGTRLSEALASSAAPLPPAMALAVGRALLSLWQCAAAGGVELLVDPDDVLIDAGGVVRVRPSYDEEQARQAVGAAVGLISAQVAYLAPERLRGTTPDGRSPMFSLGLLLYEMLTGAHPTATSEQSAFEVISALVLRDLPSLGGRRPDLHPGVIALVDRCLAREPSQRFGSWRELALAYAGVQALFAPVGPAELSGYLRSAVPAELLRPSPPLAVPADWRSLPAAGYEVVPLRAPRPGARQPAPTPARMLDRDAVYAGADARPMYALSTSLLIDARPVTRGEVERFFLLTGAARPGPLAPLCSATDDEPCSLLPVEAAEAYARWAGKRLPTEAEWQAAVGALGAQKLGVGEVWEWTATAHPGGGRVVRGGRWRDVSMAPARPENRSFSTSAAADIGFRCVLGR